MVNFVLSPDDSNAYVLKLSASPQVFTAHFFKNSNSVTSALPRNSAPIRLTCQYHFWPTFAVFGDILVCSIIPGMNFLPLAGSVTYANTFSIGALIMIDSLSFAINL